MPGPGLTGLDANNSGGADGAIGVNVKRGIFKFTNSVGDPVVAGDIGKSCYVEDDNTVNHSGGTNLIKAGKVMGLDDSNASVWVDTTRPGGSVTTANATDLVTTEALANALKASYNSIN
jgi:hypothetical protein